jgi:hypothetical protein
MESNYGLEDVIREILIFSTSSDKKKIKSAEKYLINLEKSINSWKIIKDILDAESLDPRVYQQISLILKRKMQYDLYQFPAQDVPNFTIALIGKVEDLI